MTFDEIKEAYLNDVGVLISLDTTIGEFGETYKDFVRKKGTFEYINDKIIAIVPDFGSKYAVCNKFPYDKISEFLSGDMV